MLHRVAARTDLGESATPTDLNVATELANCHSNAAPKTPLRAAPWVRVHTRTGGGTATAMTKCLRSTPIPRRVGRILEGHAGPGVGPEVGPWDLRWDLSWDRGT